jgi:hypothetical protein
VRLAPFVFLNGAVVDAAGQEEDLACHGRLASIHVPDEHDVKVFPARTHRLGLIRGRCAASGAEQQREPVVAGTWGPPY